MAFQRNVAEELLVSCHRCCCVCHKFCGSKIEVHHIVPRSEGGEDTFENAIALCFDCHAEIGAYNPKHPKGRKFSPSELRRHRDQWLKLCSRDLIEGQDEIKYSIGELKDQITDLTLKIKQQENFEDMLKNGAQKTRIPIIFCKDSIIVFSVFRGDILDFFPKPRPVKIFIPDTNVGFDYVLLGVIESDGTKIKLSSTDKNLPYKFEFSLDLEKKNGQFNFEGNYQTANVSQAFNCERFSRELKQKKEIAVKDLETDKIFFQGGIDLSIGLEDDAYYEPLKDLSYIQEKTMKIIPCPTKLSKKDFWDIKEIREIIENGRIERHFSEIGFKIKKQELKPFLRKFKDNKIVSSIKFNITDVKDMIFGVKIPLGSCAYKLPPVELIKPVDEIEKDAENLLDEDFIKISLRPVSNKPCIMVFEKWS